MIMVAMERERLRVDALGSGCAAGAKVGDCVAMRGHFGKGAGEKNTK